MAKTGERKMQLKKMIMETVPARFDERDSWVMWHKINDEIIPAINELLTNTPPNEPLTLEQLREMDGEPVYIIIDDVEPLKMWSLIEVDGEDIYLTNNLGGRSPYKEVRLDREPTHWMPLPAPPDRRLPEGEADA